MNLKKYIREIPDWPKKGVNFKDITTLLEEPVVFQYVIDKLGEPYSKIKIDKVVGIDARGFLLAGAIAYKLKAGVSIARKNGKLPYQTLSKEYSLEYASEVMEMHRGTIKKNEKVLIVDDLIATGGTLTAAGELILEMGGEIVGVAAIIELPFLGGSKKLREKYRVDCLVSYDSE